MNATTINRLKQLKTEWNQNKNAPVQFEEVTKGCDTPFWWTCSEGHDWQARFSNRYNGTNCPYCSGKLPIKGVTDLASCYPEIAAEWHPTKNNSLLARDFLPGSNQYVWWQCQYGH